MTMWKPPEEKPPLRPQWWVPMDLEWPESALQTAGKYGFCLPCSEIDPWKLMSSALSDGGYDGHVIGFHGCFSAPSVSVWSYHLPYEEKVYMTLQIYRELELEYRRRRTLNSFFFNEPSGPLPWAWCVSLERNALSNVRLAVLRFENSLDGKK